MDYGPVYQYYTKNIVQPKHILSSMVQWNIGILFRLIVTPLWFCIAANYVVYIDKDIDAIPTYKQYNPRRGRVFRGVGHLDHV